jgi:hypothetical protein
VESLKCAVIAEIDEIAESGSSWNSPEGSGAQSAEKVEALPLPLPLPLRTEGWNLSEISSGTVFAESEQGGCKFCKAEPSAGFKAWAWAFCLE